MRCLVFVVAAGSATHFSPHTSLRRYDRTVMPGLRAPGAPVFVHSRAICHEHASFLYFRCRNHEPRGSRNLQ